MGLSGAERRAQLLRAAAHLERGDAVPFLDLMAFAAPPLLPDAATRIARALAGLWPAAEAGRLGSTPEIAASLSDAPAFAPAENNSAPEHVAHARRRLLAVSLRAQLRSPTPTERVAWALDVLLRLFDRIHRSESTRHGGSRQLPSADETRAWWAEVLNAPPTDFSDGGLRLTPWKPSLLRGLRAEAGDRLAAVSRESRAEFELGVSLSATLELSSIGSQVVGFSHTLRPAKLFGLLTTDDTWKALVTRAGELPSFHACGAAIGVGSDRSALLAAFRADLEAVGSLAAAAWCQLSLLASLVEAMTTPDHERLGNEAALVASSHRAWGHNAEVPSDGLAFPLGWGHARNNLFKKCQRCVPVLAAYPDRLLTAIDGMEEPERWTAHAFRYYGHRWMSDQREDQARSRPTDDPDDLLYDEWTRSESVPTGPRRVYQSLRLTERPVLGQPCIEDLETAPVSRALTPIAEDEPRWLAFRDQTIVLLLTGGASGLFPWARGETVERGVRTRLERWRSKLLDGKQFADNPWVNAQNWRYGDLRRAICSRETALATLWTEVARAVVEHQPHGREALVGVLTPWLHDPDTFPARMKWSLCVKNAAKWLERT